MRRQDGSPARGGLARQWLTRVRGALWGAPPLVKLALLLVLLPLSAVALPLLLLAGVCYAPVAITLSHRTPMASLAVAVVGMPVVYFLAGGRSDTWLFPLLVLPFAAVPAAHARPFATGPAPCRTVGWIILWSLPPAMLAWRLDHAQPVYSYAVGWSVALVVLVWRFARVRQGARGAARVRGGRATLAAPPGGGTRAGQVLAPGPGDPGAAGADAGRRAAAGPRQRAETEGLPTITVEDAMAELDALIGLEPVKDQIRQLRASVEAARRRARAGYQTGKPMQHFVFLGPPGTGKTSVARIIAKVYYAFGLLESPFVVEAQRADMVGEYLGSTAVKTNELVDSALGGVLFLDEAYSLDNDSDGRGDRFGAEAVQALLKRAEDDRDNLIVILAGYERQMEDFLASNPGLNSRFALRIRFSGYSPGELTSLALAALARRGESLAPEAAPALARLMQEVGRRRLGDDLGNGRFVRSLLDKAGQARDVRVMAGRREPAASDLVILESMDLERAFAELTSRFRGYTEAPTVESALAELDELIGLEPVKRQVHEIAAQLRVAKLRDRHGLLRHPPARHFVFTGPPGTGKTTVARVLGRIFAALGLLVRPEVVEAHRADLVGEHLGATALKTGRLIDSALGGVLFIDEAYSLYNDAYSGGDAYGAEAVATLLKRAEDDRDRLVIVLAGYPADMERFLRSNPGLSSRFSTRIDFPSYSAAELAGIATMLAEQAGDSFEPEALPVLNEIFRRVGEGKRIDELGNGRFSRLVFERACAARDLRVAGLGDSASAADLTTVTVADLTSAVAGFGLGPSSE